jgi:cobalt/nickel transport system permease protein
MLNGAVCPVTVALGAAGGAALLYAAFRREERPSAFKFAGVTALIFAMQMLNFPVANGTSGHLLGGALAVALLGLPFAGLSVAAVLLVQAIFFGDGGVNALGANVFNMGLIGVVSAGVLWEILKRKGMPQMAALAAASWASVMLAALACSFEVAFSGAVPLAKVVPAMLSVHALIGIGEAVLTVALVLALGRMAKMFKVEQNALAYGAMALAVAAVFLSPLASSSPDGLERVAGQLAFLQFQGIQWNAFFPDYQVPGVSLEAFSTVLAGMAGVGIILAASSLTGLVLKNK